MIYLNLIPSNLWEINLRKFLSDMEWKALSLHIRQQANWTCYCCQISLKDLKEKRHFHAHEYWNFIREKKQVDLVAIVCICSKCHDATHFGLASVKNRHQEAMHRIMKVNHWSYEDVKNYIEVSFENFYLNSSITWTINLVSFEKWLTPSQILKIKAYLCEKKINYFS